VSFRTLKLILDEIDLELSFQIASCCCISNTRFCSDQLLQSFHLVIECSGASPHLKVSPNGRYIAAGTEDGFLFVFDLASSALIQQHEGHSGAVASVEWAPDQKQLVTVGKDASVCVWNFFEV